MYITDLAVYSQLSSSKSSPTAHSPISVQRAPTDPYFYADIVINDAIVGSRYWLVDNSNHSTILSTGLITSDPQTLASIASYGSPMVMLLRLRNASGATKYRTYEALVPHSSAGAAFYCDQQED